MNWYLARSKRRAVQLAAAALQARGLNPYVPELRRRDRQGIIHSTLLFPSYLFFQTDDTGDALLRARSAPNVAYVIGGAAGPEPVPAELVAAIRRHCEARAGQQVQSTQE